jgi:tetratricopeptide (TPR) repeat protein
VKYLFWGVVPVVLLLSSHLLAQPPVRFDEKVRNDFFAGFQGDAERMERGMKACEEILKAEPEHAEAMVWQGAGLNFQAGQMMSRGNVEKGLPLWQKSLAQMDKAVQIAPNSIGVRVPRASVLIPTSRFVPESMRKDLAKRAVADMEFVYGKRKDNLAKMSVHRRGEVLMGLAESYIRAGEPEKATPILKQVIETSPDSEYAKEAQRWLMPGEDERFYHNCIGCHVKE